MCLKNTIFFSLSVALTKITPLAGSTAASSSSVHTFAGAKEFCNSLEELQSVLHFPEEVALRITDAEYQLFYQVNVRRTE